MQKLKYSGCICAEKFFWSDVLYEIQDTTDETFPMSIVFIWKLHWSIWYIPSLYHQDSKSTSLEFLYAMTHTAIKIVQHWTTLLCCEERKYINESRTHKDIEISMLHRFAILLTVQHSFMPPWGKYKPKVPPEKLFEVQANICTHKSLWSCVNFCCIL